MLIYPNFQLISFILLLVFLKDNAIRYLQQLH